MTIKQNCDDWIDYAYDNWLAGWIRKLPDSSYLRESAQNMIDRMTKAADEGRTEEAWNLLERLKRLSDTFYGVGKTEQFSEYQNERSEIYLECALVAYDMGDLQEAQKLLRVSTDGFQNRDLHKAVSYWLLGCVQWQLPAHFEAAVVSWERGLQIIKKVEFSDDGRETKRNEICEKMRGAIYIATRDGFPHSPTSNSPAPANPGSVSKARNGKSASSRTFSTRLNFLEYFGAIPAGDPALVSQKTEGMVGVDSLEIDGRLHHIIGIRNESEIRLLRGSEYFLMRANGDSMNNASPVSIEKNDYVLLQNTRLAVKNDIVAAVVFGPGEPETATLKRYYEDGSGRFLMSESLTESYNIRMSGKDYIQGVVIAILKPQ